MSARRLFERIRSERREIWEISDEIERLENIAKGKAIAPQPVVVHTNKLGSNLEDVAIQVVELQDKLNRRRQTLLQDISLAEDIVAQVNRSECRRVITAYYLTGDKNRRMDEIAREIPCSERAAWYYLRSGIRNAEEVYEKASEWATKYSPELSKLLENKEYALKVFGIERGNKKPRKDIAKWADVMENIDYMYDEYFYAKEQNHEYQVINENEDIAKILSLYIERYDENDDKQAWFDKIKEIAGELGYAKEVKEFKANPDAYKAHVGDVSTAIRVALTARTNTPDMYEIMQVLGKDVVIDRLQKEIERLK